MKKAIIEVPMTEEDSKIHQDGNIYYDCDYSLFLPMIAEMNEMGAPIGIGDFIEMVDQKLKSGKPPEEDKHLKYTLIVNREK